MLQYLKEVLKYALRGFVLRTDGLQIILASLVPAYFQITGKAMPADTQNAVLTYIAYISVVYVGIRILTAPYFVWRDQQAKIAELQEAADEPRRYSEMTRQEYQTKLRLELSSRFSNLVSVAMDRAGANQTVEYWANVRHETDNLKKRITELSHDERVWPLSNDVLQLAMIVIADRQEHRGNEEDRRELHKKSTELLKLLQSG